MRVKEMKFLFEGIIFSSQVIVNLVSGSLNRYEFTVTFFTKYLVNKYRECYFLVSENNNFKRIYTMDEKEEELVKILQEGLREMYNLLTRKFFISEECSIENNYVNNFRKSYIKTAKPGLIRMKINSYLRVYSE